jgi:hypothetical protein
MHPTADQRARLYSLINGLTDEQLRLFLTNHLQSISNTTFNNNQFQHYSRTQLLQQSFILVDNYFSTDLEKALYAMRQKPFSTDYRQQQQQQQQQVYRAQQQNYASSYNPTPYYYAQQPVQYNIQPSYHFATAQAVPQPLRQSKRFSSNVDLERLFSLLAEL